MYLLLLSLPSLVGGLWTTFGRDNYRSNADASLSMAYLPSEVTLEQYFSQPLGSTPLVGSHSLILVSQDGCNVTFLPRAVLQAPPRAQLPAAAAVWLACTGNDPSQQGLTQPPALTEDGSLLVAVVAQQATALYASAAAAASGQLGGVAWSVPLPFAPATPPLLFNGSALYVSAAGQLALLPTGLHAPHPPAQLLPTSAAPCTPSGGQDAFSQPPTLLPPNSPAGAAFMVLSNAGCATGFAWDGSYAWGPTPRPSTPGPAGTLTGPAVVFPPPLQRALLPLSSGAVCCLQLNSSLLAAAAAAGAAGAAATASTPSFCLDWPAGGCALLAPQQQQRRGRAAAAAAAAATATTAGLSGLAASPATPDFHGGQGYLLDGQGVLWVVSARSGAVGASYNASFQPCGGQGGCRPAPPLTPLLLAAVGGGKHRNALVLKVDGVAPGVCSGQGVGGGRVLRGVGGGAAAAAAAADNASAVTCILALSVGNGGDRARDDDDSLIDDVDDDGGAESGCLWAASIPPPGATAAAAATAATASGPSITPEGSLLLPGPSGLHVVQPSRLPPGAAQDYSLLNGIVIGVVVAGLVALLGVMGCVAYRRRVRAALEEKEGEEEEEGEGEGGEGGEGEAGEGGSLSSPLLAASGDMLLSTPGRGSSRPGMGLSLQ